MIFNVDALRASWARARHSRCGVIAPWVSASDIAPCPRGHRTVAEALADDDCRDWMQQWWTEAARHIVSRMQRVAEQGGGSG